MSPWTKTGRRSDGVPARPPRAALLALLALLAVGLLLAGGPALADSRDDARLARDVRERIDGAAALRTLSLDVVVSDGVVLLAGRVDRLADAEAAVRVASRVRGALEVRSVIEIFAAGRADHVLEAAVRSALRERPEVADGGEGVEVLVDEGRVTLRGELARGRERLALRRSAASVPGVVAVVDETTTPPVDDETLLARLTALFGLRGRVLVDGRIEPGVVEGVVTLRGAVPRPYERLVAEEMAFSLTGVRSVVNELDVVPPSRDVPLVRP